MVRLFLYGISDYERYKKLMMEEMSKDFEKYYEKMDKMYDKYFELKKKGKL